MRVWELQCSVALTAIPLIPAPASSMIKRPPPAGAAAVPPHGSIVLVLIVARQIPLILARDYFPRRRPGELRRQPLVFVPLAFLFAHVEEIVRVLEDLPAPEDKERGQRVVNEILDHLARHRQQLLSPRHLAEERSLLRKRLPRLFLGLRICILSKSAASEAGGVRTEEARDGGLSPRWHLQPLRTFPVLKGVRRFRDEPRCLEHVLHRLRRVAVPGARRARCGRPHPGRAAAVRVPCILPLLQHLRSCQPKTDTNSSQNLSPRKPESRRAPSNH